MSNLANRAADHSNMADNDDLYQPSPLRTLLVLLSVSSMYVALTPPIPRATTEEKARYRKPGPRDLSTIPITPVALALKVSHRCNNDVIYH